jgi:uncharacterized protein
MFVGRESELKILRDHVADDRPQVVVIYGRRRVGKTALIRQAIGRQRAWSFEGLEGRGKQAQVASFLLQLSAQSGKDVSAAPVTTWEAAFLLLHKILGMKRATIVLDEFQWLASLRQEMIGELKMVWELYLSQAPGRTLILCGSIASFMNTKVIQSSAFHGRIDAQIHLQSFRLRETAQMLGRRGTAEILDAQSLTGGVPKYLDLLSAAPSVQVGMERLAFTKEGYFVEEYGRVFMSHFGKNADYERLVRALAESPYGLSRSDLAAAANVPMGGTLTQQLTDLEAAGFIRSYRPLDRAVDSKIVRYVLSDAYIRFYLAFIRPKLRQISSGARSDLFAAVRQTGAFRSWMGRAFELVCVEQVSQLVEILGFKGVDYEVGPWFRAPKARAAGVQIDLVFDRADRVITLCEMKRQTAPVGLAVAAEMERRAEVVSAEHPGRTIQRVLVVDGSVSADLVRSGYFYKIVRSEDLI